MGDGATVATVATPLAGWMRPQAEMVFTLQMVSPELTYSGGKYRPGDGAVTAWMQRLHHRTPQCRGSFGTATAAGYVQHQTGQYGGYSGHIDGCEGGSGHGSYGGMGCDAGVGGMHSMGGTNGAADSHGRGYDYDARVDDIRHGSGGGSCHGDDAGVDR